MASSTGGSDRELPARLDSLLSSAVRERARDERALAEVLGGMRQDLETFAEDLSSIKKLVQRPFQPVLAAIESKLSEVQQVVSHIGEQTSQQLQASTDQQADLISQESRAVGKFVEDWSRYLDARVKEESAAVRKLVEGTAKKSEGRLGEKTEQIRALVDASTEKATDDLERHMEAAAASMRKMAEQLSDQLANAEEALRADVEVAQEALLEGIDESSEAVSEVLNEVTSLVGKQIGVSLAEGLRPFSKEARKLAERVDQAVSQIVDSNKRLGEIQGSLISYLTERDERLERVRDQALIDLVDKMSDALKGKDKKRIIDALREGDRRRKDERDAARFREGSGTTALEHKAAGGSLEGPMQAELGADGGPWLSESK